MIPHPDQRVGIFIDTQNMYYSARNIFGRRVNFKNIVADAVGDRKLIRATAYVVRTKTAEETPFFEALKKMGIELQEKELMEYESGNKKADWDVGLAVDVIRMLDMLDVVIIVSGDGDFIPLIDYVKNRGRIVEILAFRETTSTKITEVADRYTNLSGNKRRYLIGAKVATQKKNRGADTEVAEESEGFFMDQPGDQDQEQSRSRRLEF